MFFETLSFPSNLRSRERACARVTGVRACARVVCVCVCVCPFPTLKHPAPAPLHTHMNQHPSPPHPDAQARIVPSPERAAVYSAVHKYREGYRIPAPDWRVQPKKWVGSIGHFISSWQCLCLVWDFALSSHFQVR